MRGTKVGNKLCHHLDAVTPQKTSVIIGKGGTERKKKITIHVFNKRHISRIYKELLQLEIKTEIPVKIL